LSLWRQLKRGIGALTNRPASDRDVADEVAHYLDQLTAERVARGMPAAAAQRAARLELGGELNVRERVRSSGWEHVVETLSADARHAARRLRRSPGFTAVAALTLALGVGGTTAIFSAVNPILFETLPYPTADRVRVILETTSTGAHSDATFGMYRGFAERSRSFDALAVHRSWRPTMTGAEQPERFDGQRVSASYFRALGVPPVRGRDFRDDEDRAGAPGVVIISDALWHRRFGGDPAVLGRQIRLDDDSYTVIGVMPAGFANVLSPPAELWTTLQYDMSQGRAWGHHLRMVGRLHAGVHGDEAAAELNAIGQLVIREQRPPTYADSVIWSAPSLQDDITRGVRPALLAILSAVVLVLVIACVNVANLLLARGVNRREEFALRAALGAGRRRIIRQLLTESLLLALIGGALGVAVAHIGVRALVALSPSGLPRVEAIAVDPTALLFALAVTTLAGLAFGLAPALQASGREQHDLQHGSRRTAGGRHRRVRGSLVVVQVALAVVLLAGSGLLLRSMQRLLAVAPGFDATQLLTLQVSATGHRFEEVGATRRFFDAVLEAVLAVPGVEGAALTSQLPLSGDIDSWGVHFESSPTQSADDDRSAFRYAVSPNYIDVMRIPLWSGRSFGPEDHANAPLVALINESFARRRFPGSDPVGQRLRVGPTDGPLYTIIGIVGDVKQLSLAAGNPDAVYTTASQWRFEDNVMSLVVRGRESAGRGVVGSGLGGSGVGRGGVTALAPALREAIWSVDRDQPIARVATLDELLAASAAERRFALILFQVFALAALVLATAGIHGLLAGSVAERTREIGVRSAIGASRADIVSLVLGDGFRLALLGMTIGLAGAAAASGLIESLLFGVSPLDPMTYLGVIVLIAAVAAIACAVPAWRAARVDPATTLRCD
jgi:putative ABC transport system permease protein